MSKTINDNMIEVCEEVAKECLGSLSMHVEIGGDETGMVCVSSGVGEAVFFFDITAAVRGAAHCVATNYGQKFRAEKANETKAHMTALRDKLQEAVDVLNDAVQDPSKYE